MLWEQDRLIAIQSLLHCVPGANVRMLMPPEGMSDSSLAHVSSAWLSWRLGSELQLL